MARITAKKLQKIDNMDAAPLMEHEIVIPDGIKHEYTNKTTSVLEIVLKRLPIPNESTSWEQIIDFRDDSEAAGYLSGLRMWMIDLARQGHTSLEAEQKLEWL